jgi:ATP-dependent Lon protease
MAEIRLDFEVPEDLPSTLPVLPLRQGLLLPGAVSPFTVARPRSLEALERARDGWLIVAVQREPVEDPAVTDLLPVATLARLVQPLGRRKGMRAVALQGFCRVRLSAFIETGPAFVASYERLPTPWPETPEGEGTRRALLAVIDQVASKLGAEAQVRQMAEGVRDPALLVDLAAAVVEAPHDWKLDVLLTIDPLRRAEKVMTHLSSMKEILEVQRSVEERVQSDARGLEREVLLRRQLKAIRDELGEKGEDDDLAPLKEKLSAAHLPTEVKGAVERELRRLERLPGQSPERNVAVDWLNWIGDMPWGRGSGVEVDLDALEASLEESHFGLTDVKRQVVEHLAVQKLAGRGRADVLLLVGPPGVGKTSIAQAIADATQRKLVRLALGGVRDEAELRGHRRTYVGARPGRLVEGLRRAGTRDPVVLLDEVDKLGRGWQGDPASALLEILDPEQNHAFVDHYLEVPFDLSKVLFIATANDLSAVPAPLRDRMEVLDLPGYTPDEKLKIARAHVLRKLVENTGLAEGDVVVSDEALEEAIAGWTREAGVRQLQRVLGKIFRAAAVKKAKSALEAPLSVTRENLGDFLGRRRFFAEEHENIARPGVATGLAWTPVGGDVLYVEASATPGSGKLVLTGQLGDVMKESAQAALTYARVHADELGIDPEALAKKDLHLHVPAGATPKDGPSAGVTMYAALASLLSGRAVRGDVAMTGEVTLRGRVLPVGGIKAKVLAAHARGLSRVIIPERNAPDLEEVPDAVKRAMTFIPVRHVDEVLREALEPAASGPGALLPLQTGGQPSLSA